MKKEVENKNDLISQLVEVSAKPIMTAKKYWHESIYNVLKGKRENVKDDNEYIIYLKSELIYFRKLWNNELNVIYSWASEGEIPEPSEINNIIVYIENYSETCVEKGKLKFKNGKELDKNDLTFIERYTSIKDAAERIASMEEDYLYFRIRDYITLNIYQFLSQNKEIGENLLKDNSKETIQRIADLVSNFGDMCMYIGENED